MSELETIASPMERSISFDSITEVDLFLENCSSLYSLILDAIHDLSSKTLTCLHLEEMAAAVADAGRRLVIDNPDADGVVALRLNTITSALEQLRIRRGPTSDSESCSSRSQGQSETRNWIHSIEKRLNAHEITFQQKKSYHPAMTKLMADQQILQLEIQTEGQNQISRLFNHIKADSDPSSDHNAKKQSNAEAIRKKWHTIYLSSLSLQFRIEELLNRIQEDSESESDEEFQAPPLKRARRSSVRSEEADEEEDTLPFAESEYESIMDGRATGTSISSDESPARVRKWESVQQDIGYSSGENSVHEALNSLVDSQAPIHSFMSSSKMYYHVAMDDVSDVEIRKAMELKLDEEHVQNQLSESMHVNYDQNATSLVLPEYDEVMALMDETDGRVVRSESFNTSWKEIQGETPRKTRHEIPDPAKHSCDASSEEELSDWEEPALPDVMSRSFNSALTGGSTYSLKRHRTSTKKSSQLLDCSEMEASFCSTRSDMPPCMGRSFRKKLRIRRMPRSMSDGEQLGVKSGLLTPHIRISPPRTPLSSTIRLLQQLDRQLLASESDSADHEHHDMPAYEWDDYKPPEKDDSMPDDLSMSQPKSTESLLMADEDFTKHLVPSDARGRRLLEEQKVQLEFMKNILESDDLDASRIKHIKIICTAHRDHLDAEIQRNIHADTSEYRELRQQWSSILKNVENPANRMLNKIGRFSRSLQDLSHSAASGVLNSMAEIRSKEDAHAALEAITAIHKKLSMERDALRDCLKSNGFDKELPEISDEFMVISESYNDAVLKIESLVKTLRKVYGDWSSLHSVQNDIRKSMASIEERLMSANFDQNAVLDQMEFCQERMNSLETMCNYLTVTLSSIQEDEAKIAPDFKAEISIYANALRQLRSRFNELIRVPTPPTPSLAGIPSLPISPIATSTPHSTIKRVKARQTQTRAASPIPEPKHTIGSRLYRTISSSWLIKGLLTLSLAAAFAALFFTTIYGASFGPHLTYVRGPPPV